MYKLHHSHGHYSLFLDITFSSEGAKKESRQRCEEQKMYSNQVLYFFQGIIDFFKDPVASS